MVVYQCINLGLEYLSQEKAGIEFYTGINSLPPINENSNVWYSEVYDSSFACL